MSTRKSIALAAIMCPTFCMEEPPPLCEVEQVCDTKDGGFPILPIPLALFDHSGGANFHPLQPSRMPEPPELPIVPYQPPIHPLPENPPPAVVPEPSSLAIMSLVGVIGLLTMRKRVCPVD